jgi:hypothetical protein
MEATKIPCKKERSKKENKRCSMSGEDLGKLHTV